MTYVAECETCGVIKRGDLEEVGDAIEDHEQFHDVRIQRVATDGSGHVCEGCGETFRTLTHLRLHERDDCPERQTYDQIDPDGANADLQAAEGLLTCRRCGQENPNADFEETPSFADGDYHLIVEFDCRHCGFENENRVVMEGIDREDLGRLPAHLRPDEAVVFRDEWLAVLEDLDRRNDELYVEDEWDPEPAELRDGETTDIDSHARRNAEQLRMAEEHLEDDDDLATDGGQDVCSEWTLVCTDCDFEDELVTEGHPREGPPSQVEDRVREHKGTVDWSHVVRVEGRVADEDREIDPSLLTDGGQSVDGTERCRHCGREMARTSDWQADDPERTWQRMRRYQCQQCHVKGLTKTRLDGTRSTGDGFVVLKGDETSGIKQTTLVTDGGTDTGGFDRDYMTIFAHHSCRDKERETLAIDDSNDKLRCAECGRFCTVPSETGRLGGERRD